jgi:phage-related protein
MPFVAYTHGVTLPAKPVIWMGDSLDALREFPSTIQDEVGYALYLAQVGSRHVAAKPLRGLGAGTVELVSDHRSGTYRAVYTVRFDDAVYVLHAFQKKSTQGIATAQRDIELIKSRLRQAEQVHLQRRRH